MVSAASVAIGTTVYIIGGYNGQDYSEMIKLSLPEDRCHLIKDVTCKNSSGCKAIVVPGTDEKNITSCFSSDRTPPDEYVLLQYCIVFITILHCIYYNNTLYLLQYYIVFITIVHYIYYNITLYLLKYYIVFITIMQCIYYNKRCVFCFVCLRFV